MLPPWIADAIRAASSNVRNDEMAAGTA